jgi:hypothetical protein
MIPFFNQAESSSHPLMLLSFSTRNQLIPSRKIAGILITAAGMGHRQPHEGVFHAIRIPQVVVVIGFEL